MLDLTETKACDAAATKGPWEVRHADGVSSAFVETPAEDRLVLSIDAANEPADLAFVAHSRTALPVLVTEVERLQAQIDVVLALHVPGLHGDMRYCRHEGREVPCPTVCALTT